MEVFDHLYNEYQDSLENENQCPECGDYFDGNRIYCSKDCFMASQY